MPLDRPKTAKAEPSAVKKEKKRLGSPQQRNAKRRRGESASASGSGSGSQSAKRDLGVVEVLSDHDEDYDTLKVRSGFIPSCLVSPICGALTFVVASAEPPSATPEQVRQGEAPEVRRREARAGYCRWEQRRRYRFDSRRLTSIIRLG